MLDVHHNMYMKQGRMGMQIGEMRAVLRAMREIVEDAECRKQPLLVRQEFIRLRQEAVVLHAACFPGPPDGGEVSELSRRATAAWLYRHPTPQAK
jgi:hypothetical protein